MPVSLQSVLLGTIGLQVILVVSVVLNVLRNRVDLDEVWSTRRLVFVAIVLHALHLVEETLAGFHVRWPELLDLEPWPVGVFLSINLAWMTIWAACAWAIERTSAALFGLWFLAISGPVNLVAHPVLAMASGGYFPGLVTAPLVGVWCLLLFANLLMLTRKRGQVTFPGAH